MSFNYNEDLSEEQVQVKGLLVKELTKEYVDVRRDPRAPRISSIPVHSNVEQFVDAVKELVDINQETAHQRVLLLDDFSRTSIFEDPENSAKELSGVVIYSMLRRAPGTMEGGNAWFNSARREIKPRIRTIDYDNPDYPGQARVMMSQWFDNELAFSVCARTNKRANELALWFEELMEKNRQYFAAKGIAKYFFNKREADQHIQIGELGYENRPLCYFVRTERTYIITEEEINKIILSLTNKET